MDNKCSYDILPSVFYVNCLSFRTAFMGSINNFVTKSSDDSFFSEFKDVKFILIVNVSMNKLWFVIVVSFTKFPV